jgi:ribose transport system ATP-binding protein
MSGEVLGLVGENGAGKSTLMNIISGALKPDAGEMQLMGESFAPASPLEARRRGIALIHQELQLCPHLSVMENIVLGAEESRWGIINRGRSRERALELLANFSHPEIHPERLVRDLPVAAQQVVEICRALHSEARVVLMDEPTSSLQRSDVERLFALIRRLKESGIAVVYISHFLEEVREIAGRYTVLRDGRNVESGEIESVTNDHLIRRMVGRPMDGLFPPRTRKVDGEVILEVRDLSAPPAVREVSFDLRKGEILGIAGLMGSGRTELVRALYGLQPASTGRIRVGNASESATGAVPSRRLRQGFGYLSEDRKEEGLALALSVADNLTLSRTDGLVRMGGWLDGAKQEQAANRWIAAMSIRVRSARQTVRTLSGGNQQKVVIGRLLHQEAEILLLDEPTRGVDIGSKAKVYETIARAAEEGKAILMVSSYFPELFGMVDRLAVMSRGRLSPARPIEEWTPDMVMMAAIGTPEEVSAR